MLVRAIAIRERLNKYSYAEGIEAIKDKNPGNVHAISNSAIELIVDITTAPQTEYRLGDHTYQRNHCHYAEVIGC